MSARVDETLFVIKCYPSKTEKHREYVLRLWLNPNYLFQQTNLADEKMWPNYNENISI